jgi:hypothetical protein
MHPLKALKDCGWTVRREYTDEIDEMGDMLIATDPLTGEDVKCDLAFQIQEERQPGSISKCFNKT